jgi:NAD(P)-dependent dehydrogenase (short-subunit alcohol dehydrogenase family)
MMTPRTSGPIDLSGQVALVTGAARGIGRAIALALAREGAEVACADLLPAAQTVAVVGALGCRAIAVGGDVSRLADARRMVRTTVRRLGRLDILVNNAGSLTATRWTRPASTPGSASWTSISPRRAGPRRRTRRRSCRRRRRP